MFVHRPTFVSEDCNTIEFDVAKLYRRAVYAMFVLSLMCAAQTGPKYRPTQQDSRLSRKVQMNYAKLPLAFEAHRGQTRSSTQFLARGDGYSIVLHAGGIVLSLHPAEPAASSHGSQLPDERRTLNWGAKTPLPAGDKPENTFLALDLVGANLNPAAIGEEPLPTKVNYFVGNDPKQWQTNIQTYARIRYQNVYPGIDLVYYGNNRQVEYDFIVSPGANPNRIQLAAQGVDSVTVDPEGNLVLTKGGRQVHFQAPNVYQEVNGLRTKVLGGYSVKDSRRVGFKLGPHDPSASLVIDPVLVYSTFLGGRSDDQATAITVDAFGNAYVTGTTSSSDLPLTTSGTFNPDQQRMFVAKLDVSGSAFLYADYFGGTSGNDYPTSIAVDANGSAYVTGQAYSNDFPVANAYQSTLKGASNAFITKVSADGSSLVYSTYLGGSGLDYGQGIAINANGEATLAGVTSSLDFPLANACQSTIPPDQNGQWGSYGFFSRLSADGLSLIYSSYLGGSNNWYGEGTPMSLVMGIALDLGDNLYIAGNTTTTDFPTTPGAYRTTSTGQPWVATPFISKFNNAGGIVYSTYFGGTYTNVTSVAVDTNGSAYVTGFDPGDDNFPITSTSLCNPGSQSCQGGYAAKLSPDGSTLAYSTYLAPDNSGTGQTVQVDANGDAYIAGNTYSSQYPTVTPLENFTGGSDLLIVELNPTGTAQLFATFIGGDQDEYPYSMVLDSHESLYIAGWTASSYFPVTQSAFQGLWGGKNDAFVLKIAPDNKSAVSVAPSLLQYSTLSVGASSLPQSATLRNMGSASLNIATKTISGDFIETDDCGATVAPGSFCTFSISFVPTAPGARFGTIELVDDASASPHLINMVGDGSSPTVTLSPSNLTFTSVLVGQSSAPQRVTLSNTGSATLNISSISSSGPFVQTNNCPPALALGSSCTLQVTFTPTASGTQTGTLTFSDSAANSPQVFIVTGTGVDFAMSTSVNSATVNAGGTANYSLLINPVGGVFSANVALSCTEVPAFATCTISPNSVSPGARPVPVTVRIATAKSIAQRTRHGGSSDAGLALQALAPAIGLLGCCVFGTSRRRKQVAHFVALVILGVGILAWLGCGTNRMATGQQGTATPQGSYTVQVIGTSGMAQHFTSLTLNVQ